MKTSANRSALATALIVLVSLVWLAGGIFPSKRPNGFDLEAFGRIPVLNGGRVKPLDTVARTSLLMLSGKQVLKTSEGQRKQAIEWAADMLFDQSAAGKYPVFRIDNPDVLGLLGMEQGTQTLFPYEVLEPALSEISKQYMRADRIEPARRTVFENSVAALGDRISLYHRLQASLVPADVQEPLKGLEALSSALPEVKGKTKDLDQPSKELAARYLRVAGSEEFMVVPQGGDPEGGQSWRGTGAAMQLSLVEGKVAEHLLLFAKAAEAWKKKEPESFNSAVSSLLDLDAKMAPAQIGRAESEQIFNRYEPFYKSMVLYVAAMVLALLFWLTGSPWLSRSAFALLALGFIVQSAGLLSRMILQGRPPVTNLYSSAVFVGWGAVLFGLIAEWFSKRGMINALASAIGFTTLILAHHLSLQGDTMEMMRAVLDSNFWLATHVVTITIGYSATFIAGAVGILYLLRRAFDRSFTPEAAKDLSKVLYGLLWGSAFFCFIGTVLGGIWADQSWGRFWGWDPKENGALLIVLWVLFIMHARAGRLFSEATIMAYAVFGNVVTAFAWFGVNMLNIGLHSYGPMEQGFKWLIFFSISQLLIMALALKASKVVE